MAATDAHDVELNAFCGAPSTDASVWYELSASVDAEVFVDVSQSVGFPAGVLVATGTPGSFRVRNCQPGALQFEATAGERYVILAFDAGAGEAGNGGQLDIRITQTERDSAFLSRILALPGVVTKTRSVRPSWIGSQCSCS